MAPTMETLLPPIVYVGENNETIRMENLVISEIAMPGFQRDRKNPHIDKIAAEYDATAYLFPAIALFKGEYICIDGQQRIAAREKNGEASAWCLLIEGVKSEARLADIFLKINRDRKLLDALEKYIGAVAAKDRGTLEVKRIVEDLGFEVAKSASANGKVPAGAVMRIYNRHGGDVLQRTMYVRGCSWGQDSSREANEAKTLEGIAQFLKRYWDKVDDEHLIATLSKQHPGYLLQAIDKKRGLSQTVTYADYIREQYNKGRRGKGGRL